MTFKTSLYTIHFQVQMDLVLNQYFCIPLHFQALYVHTELNTAKLPLTLILALATCILELKLFFSSPGLHLDWYQHKP